ncbi:hypothetical protein [Parachryseolinea silvisoli]|uniref:hypothetical protein n=1 Tax=Parachryseolinea silvisoli TaxID=2873601 RepID=UPI00226595EB|nr:hypothetical protein [Parachryseolinea silvisoli]MCD9017099.1 hypothetical protein [Parachryseolinea silvisoli]
MKKRTLSTFLSIALLSLLAGCNTTTPEQYFDITVLNSNLVVGFANDGDFREFEQPSAILKADNTIGTSTRAQVVETKIQVIEGSIEKIKGLPDDHDGKPMKDAALALYEYVLPIYKNEYTELARQYDTNATRTDIEASITAIHDKYYKKYDDLYQALTDLGKTYATKHNITVNWGN